MNKIDVIRHVLHQAIKEKVYIRLIPAYATEKDSYNQVNS